MTKRTKIIIGWAALIAAVAVGLWLGRAKPVKLMRLDFMPYPQITNKKFGHFVSNVVVLDKPSGGYWTGAEIVEFRAIDDQSNAVGWIATVDVNDRTNSLRMTNALVHYLDFQNARDLTR